MATITLTDVEAGTYMVYVKFAPPKHADWGGPICATNLNSATATVGEITVDDSAEAQICVVQKMMD